MKVISVTKERPKFVLELNEDEVRYIRTIVGNLNLGTLTSLGGKQNDGLYDVLDRMCIEHSVGQHSEDEFGEFFETGTELITTA